MRQRTSPIWLMPDNEFKHLIQQSVSKTEVLRHFGFANKGRNAHTLVQRLEEQNVDYSHFKINVGEKGKNVRVPLELLLVENSKYSRTSLKKRLLAEGLLKNECVICGQQPTWYGRVLIMILDHKNGIGNDNRLCNLRLLCPNCNTQMETFAGRNNKGRKYGEVA